MRTNAVVLLAFELSVRTRPYSDGYFWDPSLSRRLSTDDRAGIDSSSCHIWLVWLWQYFRPREIHHAWPPIKHNISINVNSHISIHWNCEISWVIGLSYQTRIPILDMATSLPCSLVKELILFLSEVLAINPLACMQWDYGHAQLSRAGHLSEI